MRSCTRSLMILLSGWLLAGPARAQVTSDLRDIKPMMMLLVDTSGSMERVPGTDTLPTCTTGNYEKNRWAVVVETLTGEILGSQGVTPADGFKCKEEERNTAFYTGEYDYGYHLPHYEFMDVGIVRDGVVDVDQGAGVIDVYANSIRFGLMTFDGVGTILGENPLMDLATLQSFDYKDAPGMYSYGENKELLFPGCNFPYFVNAGARRKANTGESPAPAGALISVGDSDTAADIISNNDLVQASLVGVRPFGGTPTAALLEDFKYYLEHDDDVKDGGDPYFECRKRYAVLLTDGAPDKMFRDSRYNCSGTTPVATCLSGQPCVCPYEESQTTARELVHDKLIEKLSVVAFDLGSDEVAQAELDLIAVAGSPDGKGEVLQADDADALKDSLAAIAEDVTKNVATRTIPVTVAQQLLPSGSPSPQFELRSGFIFTGTPGLREGFLERQKFECANGAIKDETPDILENQGDRFEVSLRNRDEARTIRTFALPTGAAAAGTVLGTEVKATDLASYSLPTTQLSFRGDAIPDPSGLDPVLLNQDQVTSSVASEDFQTYFATTARATEYLGASADVAVLTEYVAAFGSVSDEDRTARPAYYHRLRDILHSTPAVLLPNDSRTPNRALNAFRRSFLTTNGGAYPNGRPAVVYVATNDGVLHAFNLDTWTKTTDIDPGYEFWGFLPPTVFSSLKTAALPTHMPLFDGSPLVRDMVLVQNRGSTAGLDCDPPRALTGLDGYCFGTVVLAPLRGEAAFLALDVTLPDEDPVPLWQISDGQMGKTVGAPALGYVDVDLGAGLQRRAVAILPGGQGTLASSGDSDFVEHTTPTAPDAADGGPRSAGRDWKTTGRLLLVVDVRSGQVLRRFDSRFFPAPITGAVAIDGSDAVVSRYAYVTDADGVLWRLSLVDNDPANWTVEPIWDVFHDHHTPTGFKEGSEASFAPVLSRDVAGNTVILLGTGSLDATQSATAQHYVVSLQQSLTAERTLKVTANWEYKLQPSEVVTGPLSLLEGVTYFGTLVPFVTNPCEAGKSRLWGVDYIEKDTDDLPKARLQSGSDVVRFEEQSSDKDSSLVLGVGITRQPLCVVGTTQADPIVGQRFVQTAPPGGGAYQLRGLRSGDKGDGGKESGMADVKRTLSVTHTRTTVNAASSIE